MTLNRESWLVKWTYLMTSSGYPPKKTTLCRFFWRCFVFMPLFATLVLGFLGGILYQSWQNPIPTAIVVAAVIVIFLGCVVGSMVQEKLAYSTLPQQISQSVFVQGLKAVKGKFCPIITIS